MYKEIISILKSCSLSLALEDNKIPFYFLKALGKLVACVLTHLADVCLKLKCYLAFLKTACTIILQKPGKSTYRVLNTWQPIVLLKTISKVVEKLFTKRIKSIVKEY